MADKGYVLSAADLALFRELVGWWRQRKTTGGRWETDQGLDHQEHPTPDVYIARVPDDGIPGLNLNVTGTASGSSLDDQPGSAECDIYKIIQQSGGLDGTGTGGVVPLLQAVTGVSRTVYNLSRCAIEAASDGLYIAVTRDKYGSWVALSPPACAADAAWVECTERVIDVLCVDGQIAVVKVYDYWTADGRRVYTSNTGCGLSLTLSGVTDDGCTDCDNFNGPFDLFQTGEFNYSSPLGGTTLCDTPAYLELSYNSSDGKWSLSVIYDGGDGTAVGWQNDTAGASWDRSTPITFTQIGSNDVCGWPAEVEVGAM